MEDQFAASGWGKKVAAKATRAALSDFGRFKVAIAKQKVRLAALRHATPRGWSAARPPGTAVVVVVQLLRRRTNVARHPPLAAQQSDQSQGGGQAGLSVCMETTF
eukprot:COSAG01_NODE_12863_length_1673_cov_1.046379_2_plen_105_part_00